MKQVNCSIRLFFTAPLLLKSITISINQSKGLLLFVFTNVCRNAYCGILCFSFLYQMPTVADIDVWTLLWVVLLTDFVVKFATVAVKCLVFLLPSCCVPYRSRVSDTTICEWMICVHIGIHTILFVCVGIHTILCVGGMGVYVSTFLMCGKMFRLLYLILIIQKTSMPAVNIFIFQGQYYMFIEKLSQLYRITLPIIPWIHYLQDDQEIGRWFALVTVIIYILFKVRHDSLSDLHCSSE